MSWERTLQSVMKTASTRGSREVAELYRQNRMAEAEALANRVIAPGKARSFNVNPAVGGEGTVYPAYYRDTAGAVHPAVSKVFFDKYPLRDTVTSGVVPRPASGNILGLASTYETMNNRPDIFAKLYGRHPKGWIQERLAHGAVSRQALQDLRELHGPQAGPFTWLSEGAPKAWGPLSVKDVSFTAQSQQNPQNIMLRSDGTPVVHDPRFFSKQRFHQNVLRMNAADARAQVASLPRWLRPLARSAYAHKRVGLSTARAARDTFTPWQTVKQVGQTVRDAMPYVRNAATQTSNLARSALTAAKPYAGQVKNVAAGAATAALAAGKAYAAPAAAAAGKFVALPAAAAGAGAGIGYGARRLSNHLSGGLYDKGMNAAGNWLADQTAGRYYNWKHKRLMDRVNAGRVK